MFYSLGMEYRTLTDGTRRRVHREYVVTEEGTFGAETRGRRQACYHVRFGGHETELYLERRSAVPAVGQPEELRWWVFAYDQTRSREAGE